MTDKVQKGGMFGIIKTIYQDPYMWSVVKSVSFFALGIHIARQCVGLEVMGPPQ